MTDRHDRHPDPNVPDDHWDEETDLLVFGSGVGGLCAALYAAKAGLRVLLCEKSSQLGGTTAVSGGVTWIPCSAQAGAAGVDDSLERARDYLRHELGNHYRPDLVDAFLESGPVALAALEADTEVRFDLLRWPDYHPGQPGGAPFGRTLEPRGFDGRKLGRDFALVRPPIKRLMLFGGMYINKRKLDDFLNPFRSFDVFRRVMASLVRYAMDRLRYERGTDIGAGNALVARLFYSLRQRSVPIWIESPLIELVGWAGRVRGAVVDRRGVSVRVRARHGVVLATGGFPGNPAMRAEFASGFAHHHTMAFEGNVGDGINAARALGAAVDTDMATPAFWTPLSVHRQADGSEAAIPYGYLDRGRPGVIAVDASGRRFVNEANSYHDVVTAMFEQGAGRGSIFHFVCDRKFVWKRGLGLIRPFRLSLARHVESNYIIVADTLPELARRIGVDPEGLVETVRKHNSYAASGVDVDFGKGSTLYNTQMFGDPEVRPNPNLAPIESPPFIALRIHPGTLGTAVGLKANADAQVTNGAGEPIHGLYACGNEFASVMRGRYPAGGITIGPAIAFAYRAVQHAASAPATNE